MATGNKCVILAVDWLTRWAEGEATKDASPEAAADFIYTHIVTRFGCPGPLCQPDNQGPVPNTKNKPSFIHTILFSIKRED